MTGSNPNQVQLAKVDLRLVSNAGRVERERWVLDRWCALTGRSSEGFVKGEPPDFTSLSDDVEITEIMLPGRKRGDEFKATVQAFQQGLLPALSDAAELQEVVAQAHNWIADAVFAKAQHYGVIANGWILLVYANYAFSTRTQWPLIRQRTAGAVTFKEIHVLTADGQQVQRLKP